MTHTHKHTMTHTQWHTNTHNHNDTDTHTVTFFWQIGAQMPLKQSHIVFGNGELGFRESFTPITIRRHHPLVQALGPSEDELLLKTSVGILPHTIDDATVL